MIIVSQDRTKILNFNNIISLGIKPSIEESYTDTGVRRIIHKDRFCIMANCLNGDIPLGEYGPEERAKGVLGEIEKSIAENKIIEMYSYIGNVEEANRHGWALTPVYKMPEE